MMTTENLLIEKSKLGVATLTLNRAEKHNAFDDELIHLLKTALDHLAQDEAVRVLVLKATGKSFSAGADLNWMQRMANYSQAENLKDAEKLAHLMHRLYAFPKPTIAVVQGAVFGGGVGLVACCDIAIASTAASFCLSEVKIGLIPAVISPYVISAMGERASRYYFLTAEVFSALQAQQYGLVHTLTKPEELELKTTQLLHTLLKNSPAALTACKDLIQTVAAELHINTQLIQETTQRIAAIRVSSEGQEGLRAFLEKRKPSWIKTE